MSFLPTWLWNGEEKRPWQRNWSDEMQGIAHKPTDAGFVPYPSDPYSGNVRSGKLGNILPNGDDYDPEDVKMLMEHLWAEYVKANPDAFKSKTRP